MPSYLLIGLQWGDEGKGKIVDLLSDRFEYVVRYQGGANAGHTVITEGHSVVLHLVPSGILRGTYCILGDGVVFDPEAFLTEAAQLDAMGMPTDRIMISSKAHMIMPYHRLIDELEEQKKKQQKIGTTLKGIGPCYSDKMNRIGLRVGDLYDERLCAEIVERTGTHYNTIFKELYGQPPLPLDDIKREMRTYAKKIAPFVRDTGKILLDALDENKKILLEGSQGAWLDIDHGTYPFVTSSSTMAGGACSGAPMPPTALRTIIGIAKAYTTRVGEGPMPTEMDEATGEMFQKTGKEFGSTTGRLRRCGWFDAPLVRHAARLNGLTDIVLTKLDVLSGIEKLSINVGYQYGGKRLSAPMPNIHTWSGMKPIYETMPGWEEDISDIRRFEELPSNCQNYVRYIEETVGYPISMISVGPSRTQIIELRPIVST